MGQIDNFERACILFGVLGSALVLGLLAGWLAWYEIREQRKRREHDQTIEEIKKKWRGQ